MNENPRRFQNLSRAELQRVEERFRRRRIARSGRQTEDVRTAMRRQRRLLWLSFGVGLIVIAVIGSLYRGPTYTTVQRPVGPPAPRPTGDARVPIGADEVRDARLAVLAGLAAGADAAQQAQIAAMESGRFPIEIRNSVGIRFRLIPAGSFDMGSPADQWGHKPDELLHEETVVAPFYMASTEITQGQWIAVMGANANPSTFPDDPTRPVENISWNQAIRYCKNLAAMEGLPEGVYRLPYESEWEYACRAGSQTPFHFEGGEERLTHYADYAENNYRQPAYVAQRLPNAFGLYNMHGNVWEWCMNPWYEYASGEQDDRFRSLRGGNWRLSADDCRSASRYRYTPSSKGSLLGFRIIRVMTNATLRDVPDESTTPVDGSTSDSTTTDSPETPAAGGSDSDTQPAAPPSSTDSADADPSAADAPVDLTPNDPTPATEAATETPDVP